MRYFITLLASAVLPLTTVSAQSDRSAPENTAKFISCELGQPSAALLYARSTGPVHPFSLLIDVNESGQRTTQVRFFDPANLLSDAPLQGAVTERNGNMIVVQTDLAAAVRFKLMVFVDSGDAFLARYGEGAQRDQLAIHYVGPCSINDSANAVELFEEMSNSR
jgi:hypothetical protein